MKTSTMNLHALTVDLEREECTVGLIARRIGNIAGRERAVYRIVPTDPSIASATIGGRGDLDSVPLYVELVFRDRSVPVTTLTSLCSPWKQQPTNPGANPFHYACQSGRSSAWVGVALYADLTEEIAFRSASVASLLLQRNAFHQDFLDALESLRAGEALLRRGAAKDAAKAFQNGIAALGGSYRDTAVLDDTGLKLVLADDTAQRRGSASAAALYRNVLMSRASMYAHREHLPVRTELAHDPARTH